MSISDTQPATDVRVVEADFGQAQVGWDGVALSRQAIAIDTETTAIDKEDRVTIPDLVLMSASDGDRQVIIPGENVPAFLLAHRDSWWVFHNVAFDFWVIMQHLIKLKQAGMSPDQCDNATALLWDKVDKGQLRDSMLLDQLVVLAENGDRPKPRKLEELANSLTDVQVDKNADAKYRVNYGSLLGQDLRDVDDPGWFIYAARDALATLHVYAEVHQGAANILEAFEARHGLNAAARDHGALTENVQVKAAIAFAAVTRNGMHIDCERGAQLRKDLQQQVHALVGKIESVLQQEPVLQQVGKPLFKRDKNGNLEWTDSGAPRKSNKTLQMVLSLVRQSIDADSDKPIFIPRTEKGAGLSTKADDWDSHRKKHPFIDAWLKLEEACKMMTLIPDGGGDRGLSTIHPRYTVMVRSGRATCSKPNIQQIPRDGGLREMFVPSPGHAFIGADYSCLELRVLAQICLDMFGESKLAEVFELGVDPHANTAAMIKGMPLDDFMDLKESDPDQYRSARQQAKAVNFGVPGAMGPETLAETARKNYGVHLSLNEAEHLRERFITDVYPELGRYLESDAIAELADQFGCTEHELWAELRPHGDRPEWMPGYVSNILRGKRLKSNGEAYAPKLLSNTWQALQNANRNPKFRHELARGTGSPQLHDSLFKRSVVTRTGRIRHGCDHPVRCNTPFQGLAADGAKLALYELVKRGYRVVAFIHDEIIIEVPVDSDVEDAKRELRDVMRDAMASVVPDVPIVVGDAVVMERWEK